MALARSIALGPDADAVRRTFHGARPDSLGVIGQLIRRLNDSLGATSIVVTHDVAEALELVDYVYYMSAGKVEFQRYADQVRAGKSLASGSCLRRVRRTGPFHYPAPEYRQDLLAQ